MWVGKTALPWSPPSFLSIIYTCFFFPPRIMKGIPHRVPVIHGHQASATCSFLQKVLKTQSYSEHNPVAWCSSERQAGQLAEQGRGLGSLWRMFLLIGSVCSNIGLHASPQQKSNSPCWNQLHWLCSSEPSWLGIAPSVLMEMILPPMGSKKCFEQQARGNPYVNNAKESLSFLMIMSRFSTQASYFLSTSESYI